MYKQYTTSDAPLIPIQIEYSYDDHLALHNRLALYNDGWRNFVCPLFYATKDIKINRSTLMILTSANNLNDVLGISTENIGLSELEIKGGIQAQNGKYLTINIGGDYNFYATSSSLTENSFFRIKPNNDGSLAIQHKKRVLTVATEYPYECKFLDIISDDTSDQQKFDYILDGPYIRFRTKVQLSDIPDTYLRNFLGVDPTTNKVQANGSATNQYNFTLVLPNQKPFVITTNFNGTSYLVKYFNDFADQRYNKSVEIDTTNSIKNIPINFLVTAPYKNSLVIDDADTAVLPVNICNLKNYQSPEYK